MACMTSGASSVTLQSLYWRSSDNFSVPAESSRVNWCSPARRLEDEILESRSPCGEVAARSAAGGVLKWGPTPPLSPPHKGEGNAVAPPWPNRTAEFFTCSSAVHRCALRACAGPRGGQEGPEGGGPSSRARRAATEEGCCANLRRSGPRRSRPLPA